MPAPVTCPNPACARRSTLPDAAVGRAVRCPACGTRFTAGSGTVADAPRPAPPQTVGRFVLRAKLGAGAFGTVYRAYDPQLDREVALKVPHAGVLDSPKRVERFLREAKAAAGLAHPNIVPVFEAGADGDRHYIASALIDGRPLADAIPPDGVEFERAARLVRELAEALAFAHARGVVHRDVKPANAMLDAAYRVHLMDFGLAARTGESGEARLTSDGAVMGTPAYMAPEQAAAAADAADPPADQYSAGVVLYELLTGRPPFTGPPAVVVYNAIHTEPEPPSASRPDVPRDLEAVCLKAMAKRPADRYPDCRFLAADLRRWLAGEPVTARPVGAVERAVRWARRKPALSAAAVLAPLAALLAVVVLVVTGLAHRAERLRAEGEAQLKDTTADLGVAEKARDRAKSDAERDREAKVRAEGAKARAEGGEARKAKQEYARTVELAQREWLAGNPDRARQLLDACDPAYRGWEWRHVHRLAHAELLTLPGGGGSRDVVYSPDGARVLARGYAGWWVWDAASGKLLHEGGKGDNGTATTSAVSPDAARLLVARFSKDGYDHQVRDALTGKVAATLAGDRRRLNHAVFSPDGRRVLTASDEEPTARVWDAATGKEVAALAGHAKKVTSAAFSADGARIITGSADDTARVWEAATGKEQRVIAGDGTDVRGVAFSPDGNRVVLTGRTTRVCEAATGAVVSTIKGNTQGVAMPFDVTGSRLLTVDGKTVRVWTVGGGSELYALEGEANVSTAAFAPNGHVIVGSADGATAVWDVSRGTRSVVYRGHTGPIFAAALAPDGKRLATVSSVGPLRVWDTATRPEGLALAGREDGRAAGGYRNVIRLSPDASRLISAGPSGGFAWDLRTGAALRPPEDHARFVEHGRALAVAPAANRVLVQHASDSRLYLWAAGPATTTVELKADTRGAVVAAFSPDGSRLVTGTDDGAVRVWDATTGAPLHERKTPTYSQLKVWYAPDGRRVVYAHIEGPIAAWVFKQWEPATGAETVILPPRKGVGIDPSARNLVFSPDGAAALVFWHDGLTQVYDAKTWTPRAALKDQHDHAAAAAFSPDGSRVVVVGQAGPRVWDAASGEAVATLTGHRDSVVSIAFSPDGSRVVTTADDGARVWDAETGDAVLALPGTESAAFSPDGSRLVTADSNAVFAWDTAPLNRAFRAGPN